MRYGYAFRRIALTRGAYSIVDPDDYEKLSRFKWHLARDGWNSYARRCYRFKGRKKSKCMHRDVLEVPAGLVVDHINRNGLDNRKANLRAATHAQNICNRRTSKVTGRSKYRGVSWSKEKKKWSAQIHSGGKCKFAGYFEDEVEAAKAYDSAARKYHGEFAFTNFPDGRNGRKARGGLFKLAKFFKDINL
jgi:hypothetical protein